MAGRSRRQRIARARIDHLMDMARDAAHDGELDRADRCAGLARKVGMRYNVPMPRRHKMFVCRSCGSFLLPGVTSRTRLRDRKVSRTCLACGDVRRVPFHREVARRRS